MEIRRFFRWWRCGHCLRSFGCRQHDDPPSVTESITVDDEEDCVTELALVFYGGTSMALEKRVLSICKECAMRYIEDIEASLTAAKRRLKIPELPDWIAELVDNALREQIHLARHRSNTHLKRVKGSYGGPGKVGASEALGNVAESVYQKSVFNHTISGWLLGDIGKTDLPAFADAEDAAAAGSMFNAALCRACYRACAKRKGETVRECLKEREVEAMFRKIAKQLGRDAA